MKSRELMTRHNVIATNYSVRQTGQALFRHQFTTKTTGKVYEFNTGNSAPVVVDGDRYNIGFYEENGRNIIEPAALSRAANVNPVISLLAAKQFAKENESINRSKNDTRVRYKDATGYFWGKKYAWRQFGLMISKSAFYAYLEEISHPFVQCVTSNPDMPYSNDSSIAYREQGLEAAVDELIYKAVKKGNTYYESPGYSKKFQILGINAITDKK